MRFTNTLYFDSCHFIMASFNSYNILAFYKEETIRDMSLDKRSYFNNFNFSSHFSF